MVIPGGGCMNILLLGATGYLGGNIVYQLSNEHNIICIVRNSSNISKLNNINVNIVSNELDKIELAMKTWHIDCIINSICTYDKNNTLYEDMFVSNIIFPLEILNLAIKYDVENYITMGTSLPDKFNMYSFTKHKFSSFGKYCCENNKLNFVDLQLEMFYGGLFEPQNRFLNACKIKMQKNEDIQLTQGLQKRDIIRVEEVVNIINKLIVSDYIKGYMVLPVGSGENHSIRDIVIYMKNEMQSSSNLIFGAVPDRKGEPDTLADIRWYNDIGFKLQYSFYDGLRTGYLFS